MKKEVIQQVEEYLAQGKHSKAGLLLGKHTDDSADFERLNKRVKELRKSESRKNGMYFPGGSGRRVLPAVVSNQ